MKHIGLTTEKNETKGCTSPTPSEPHVAEQSPKVRMGSGALPPRVAKHLPKIHMGSGALPPRLARHLTSSSQ
jgi:hypothetical protein